MIHAPEEWVAKLELDPTAFVAPGAVVVGTVRLAARSSVWFQCVLRGDSAPIVVGEESNLQDGTIVHVDEGVPTEVGARVTVGHRAVIHGCVIGDDCLVGMGAIVLSGARIGSGSLVGAGSLVREGQQIPEGSLVLGSPARVMGRVSEAHRESIRRGSIHYVALARSYLERGFARPHPFAGSDAGIQPREPRPMSFEEWGRLLAALAGGPDWTEERLERLGEARFRTAPGPGRWAAVEVLAHLRDSDLEVYLPRLERVLTEPMPAVPDVDMSGWNEARHYKEQPPREVLGAWREARRRLITRLAPLGRREWARCCVHSIRGAFPVGEMVRAWTDHDLAHRRQIARALGEW